MDGFDKLIFSLDNYLESIFDREVKIQINERKYIWYNETDMILPKFDIIIYKRRVVMYKLFLINKEKFNKLRKENKGDIINAVESFLLINR